MRKAKLDRTEEQALADEGYAGEGEVAEELDRIVEGLNEIIAG
jgi:hypothetical protein